MKRVLYHFRTRGTGPEGVHIAGIADGFASAGYQVDFVSPTDRNPSEHRGANPFRQSREGLLQRMSRRAPQCVFELGEMAYNRSALRKMEAQGQGAECSWIYERYAFFCRAAMIYAKRIDRPYALEVNELSGEERVRAQTFQRKCRRDEDAVLRNAKAVFPVSQYLADRILERGVPAERVHVVPNGVDERLFFDAVLSKQAAVRERFGFSENDRLFCFVGWFVPWHQLDQLIRAFSEAYGDVERCKLVLAGDGPLKDDLQRTAAQAGVLDKVSFPGPIEYQEIPAFLEAMDVGVVPAVNAYRSPIKLFEYMAAGLSVVSARVEAVTSVLPVGQESYLFDQSEPKDIVRALRAAEKPEDDIGPRNREHCRANFTYQRHALRIAEIMEH